MQPPEALPPHLLGVLSRYRGAGRCDNAERKPGRPVKRTGEYLRALAVDYEERFARFVSEHGRRPSVRQLYTEVFAKHFEAAGERPSRASTADFQRTLKTLQNELAEARRFIRTNPVNPAISGTDKDVQQ